MNSKHSGSEQTVKGDDYKPDAELNPASAPTWTARTTPRYMHCVRCASPISVLARAGLRRA
jgi:hypothetical protein